MRIITITMMMVITTIIEHDRLMGRRPASQARTKKSQTKKNPPMAGVNKSGADA
ncbi:hypothetical protein [Paraburkholderia diazotrophica]|uniref:hypothetical protein n=1 Tax=Paraburkholderia diazotrophica TaxID=667676 RepID=UPI0015A5428E|nr:hypothetical protein [Paraburkholderia diazotrophica]